MKINKVFHYLTSCCLTTLTSRIATLWLNCLRAVSHHFTTTGLSQLTAIVNDSNTLSEMICKKTIELYIIDIYSREITNQYNRQYMQAEDLSLIINSTKNPSEEINDIKQKLENCFQASNYSAEFEEFLREVADFNDITLDEARINAYKVIPLLIKIRLILEQINHNNKIYKLSAYINLFNFLGDLVSQHWEYLPDSCQRSLKIYYQNKFDNLSKINQNTNHKEILSLRQKILVIFYLIAAVITSQQNILVELKTAVEYFKVSMQKVLRNEEENRIDWEIVSAARNQIEEEGTTSWEDLKLELGIRIDPDGTVHQDL